MKFTERANKIKKIFHYQLNPCYENPSLPKNLLITISSATWPKILLHFLNQATKENSKDLKILLALRYFS